MRRVTWTCSRCGDIEEITIHPDPCVLDAAWAEAEAALPDGWAIDGVLRGDPGPWVAHIADDWRWAESHHDGYGPTPAAALRDLAAKLREALG